MKYYQTSALTGDNIEKMFTTIIEDIIELQATKRKKILEEDLDAPLTVDNLHSARRKPEQATESSQKPNNKPVQIGRT